MNISKNSHPISSSNIRRCVLQAVPYHLCGNIPSPISTVSLRLDTYLMLHLLVTLTLKTNVLPSVSTQVNRLIGHLLFMVVVLPPTKLAELRAIRGIQLFEMSE